MSEGFEKCLELSNNLTFTASDQPGECARINVGTQKPHGTIAQKNLTAAGVKTEQPAATSIRAIDGTRAAIRREW